MFCHMIMFATYVQTNNERTYILNDGRKHCLFNVNMITAKECYFSPIECVVFPMQILMFPSSKIDRIILKD